MKKGILLAGIIGMGLLAGCSEATIKYEGKWMPVSDAEEKIADKLEVDNSDKDLEVNITTEED